MSLQTTDILSGFPGEDIEEPDLEETPYFKLCKHYYGFLTDDSKRWQSAFVTYHQRFFSLLQASIPCGIYKPLEAWFLEEGELHWRMIMELVSVLRSNKDPLRCFATELVRRFLDFTDFRDYRAPYRDFYTTRFDYGIDSSFAFNFAPAREKGVKVGMKYLSTAPRVHLYVQAKESVPVPPKTK